MKVKVCVDEVQYKKKPTSKSDIVSLSRRIAKQAQEVSLNELKDKIKNGQTFLQSTFTNNVRKNENWQQQQVFFIDIDNEEYVVDKVSKKRKKVVVDFEKQFTVDKVFERLKEYNIKPFIIYNTFSNKNGIVNKFRVGFCLEHYVTDYRLQKVVSHALLNMFAESDSSCTDAARIFFGSKDDIVYFDETATFSVSSLVEAMKFYTKIKNEKNAARTITNYCTKCNINSLDDIEVLLNGGTVDFIKDTKVRKEFNKTLNDTTIIYEKSDEIRDFDFNALEEHCQLFREFKNCHDFQHNEKFGLATNLLKVKGGYETFIKYATFDSDFHKNKWISTLNDIKRKYKPSDCISYCNYCNNCVHPKNLLKFGIKTKQGNVIKMSKNDEITLKEADTKFNHIFQQCIDCDKNGVFAIKAPTGLGKTETLLKHYKSKNAIIAVPNHKLKDDLKRRAEKMGIKVIAIPEMPKLSQEDSKILERYYSVGSSKKASSFKRTLKSKEMIDYFTSLDKCKKFDGMVITTHERLKYLSESNKLIIIDEDIVQTLLAIRTMNLYEFRKLCLTLTDVYNNVDSENLTKIYKQIVDAPEFSFKKFDDLCIKNLEQIENIVVCSNDYKSNVLDFINCSYYVKNGDVVHYITHERLATNNKIIILSATLNEFILKHVFDDRYFEFYEVSNVKNVGTMIQYQQKSYSRNQLAFDNINAKIVEEIVGDTEVITYKAYKNLFKNALDDVHFGKCVGVDTHKSKNLAVVGTPRANMQTYGLYAKICGLEVKSRDFEVKQRQIIRNNYKFACTVCSDNKLLQEIEFYIIESELMQAVGRARLLREKATVTIFSTYPLPCIDNFEYISSEQYEKLKHAAIAKEHKQYNI